MSKVPVIFVGIERNEDVESLIACCRERDRVFVEDPTYLETVTVGGRSYIGKRLADNAPLDRIEDSARSVASLLGRVNASLATSMSVVRIVAAESAPEIASRVLDEED